MRLLWFWLLCSLPGLAQTPVRLIANGELQFGGVTLQGRPQIISARSAPSYHVEVQAGGTWSLVFQASDLSNGFASIPAEQLQFAATGSPPLSLDGLHPGGLPAQETGRSGPLRQPLMVAQFFGAGRWRYVPAAGQFQLTIPASAYAGGYSGTLTASLISGLP